MNRPSFESIFGNSDERTPYRIDPLPRRVHVPRLALSVFVLAIALALACAFLDVPALHAVERALFLAGVLASCVVGMRAEERLFVASRRARGSARLFALSIVALLVLGAGVELSLTLSSGRAWPMQHLGWLVVLPCAWLASAAHGSIVLLAFDSVLRKSVPDLRRRVTFAVLGLIALAFVLCGAVAYAALQWLDFAKAQGIALPILYGVDLTQALPIDELRLHPSVLAVAAFFAAAVFALPAVLSACTKLADTVLERLTPLAQAFALVAEGDRSVRLEEAGSQEFITVATSFNDMVDKLYLAERIERAFGQYVSVQVLERIRAQDGRVSLAADLRQATVFFADIRGFTPLSERLEPKVVVGLLNRYFEQVVPVVDAHHGFLNKFIGDAVVVVFNGPIDQADHAERAVRCAIALQQRVIQFSAQGGFAEAGKLEIGIGVATGPMLCGNVGTQRRLEYTVIGDTVNLASRMTSHAGPGEVWVAEETARLLPSSLPAYANEPIRFKGKDHAIVPFCVWPEQAARSRDKRGRGG